MALQCQACTGGRYRGQQQLRPAGTRKGGRKCICRWAHGHRIQHSGRAPCGWGSRSWLGPWKASQGLAAPLHLQTTAGVSIVLPQQSGVHWPWKTQGSQAHAGEHQWGPQSLRCTSRAVWPVNRHGKGMTAPHLSGAPVAPTVCSESGRLCGSVPWPGYKSLRIRAPEHRHACTDCMQNKVSARPASPARLTAWTVTLVEVFALVFGLAFQSRLAPAMLNGCEDATSCQLPAEIRQAMCAALGMIVRPTVCKPSYLSLCRNRKGPAEFLCNTSGI